MVAFVNTSIDSEMNWTLLLKSDCIIVKFLKWKAIVSDIHFSFEGEVN